MVLYWDFDGTLVHAEHLWSSSVFYALKAVVPNTQLVLSDILPHMAHGFPWHTPKQDHTDLVGRRWWDHMNAHFYRTYTALGVESEYAGQASNLVREMILQPERYTLFPDCRETLQETVRRGLHNVLLSNNHPDLAKLMDALDLARYFEHFIISGEVGYDKPCEEIFSLAMAHYPDEDTHVMIGDSISADIRGGKAAGMKTILVHKPPSVEADFSLPSLSELFSALPSSALQK